MTDDPIHEPGDVYGVIVFVPPRLKEDAGFDMHAFLLGYIDRRARADGVGLDGDLSVMWKEGPTAVEASMYESEGLDPPKPYWAAMIARKVAS